MRRARFLSLLVLPVVVTAAKPAFASNPATASTGAIAGQNASYPAIGRSSDEECLTAAIAYEAGTEPVDGRRAVADVILNRTRSRAHPATVCGVVYEGSERRTGCQFTFTCDGSLRRPLPVRVMEEARQIAQEALIGGNPVLIGGAINYHADYVSPYWAASMVRVAQIGRHIFYRSARSPGPARLVAPGADRPPSANPAAARQGTAVFAPWGISLSPLR